MPNTTSPLHLIAFLGTGNYQDCTYGTKEQSYQTPFTQVALNNFHQPEKITIFVTEEALTKHGKAIKDALPEKAIRLVTVPSCSEEEEIWQLFDILTEHIQAGDRIIFDITHGFRAQPLLGLLALAYMRETKQIEVERVCYGAFDAPTEMKPFFDLTPFVSLLDWLKASYSFRRSGDASEIEQLSQKAQAAFYRNAQGNEGPAPRILQNLGKLVKVAADNLTLLRSSDIESGLENVESNLAQGQQEASFHAKPLLGILDHAVESLRGIPGESLEAQRQQILWLATRGHAQASLTLAREWLVNWFITRHLGGDEQEMIANYHTRDPRKPFEDSINTLVINSSRVENKTEVTPEIAPIINSWQTWAKSEPERAKEILGLYSLARDTRNAINHAGYSKPVNQEPSAGVLLNHLSKVIGGIEKMEL